MSFPVVSGASVMCTMGMSPGQLIATSQTSILMGGKPVATIQDVAPNTNVTPCGMCTSMANPAVAAATAAALGVLTPAPCTPVPMGTWICQKGILAGGVPVLYQDGRLTCSYGGSISIVMSGQQKVVS